MSEVRRLAFVARASDAPAPRHDTATVVLDTAWSPDSSASQDLLPLRTVIAAVLGRTNPFEAAYRSLDDWAAAVDVPGRMTVEGTSWWFPRRLGTWLWLHERFLWLDILDELLGMLGRPACVDLPEGEPALADAARLLMPREGWSLAGPGAAAEDHQRPLAGDADAAGSGRPAGDRSDRVAGRLRWYLGYGARHRRRTELARRDALLVERVSALAARAGPTLLVLTAPRVHQVIRAGDTERRLDPFLGAIVESLAATSLRPVGLELGVRRDDDAAWGRLATDRWSLPDDLLASRWADPADMPAARAVGSTVAAALAGAPTAPLEHAGVDIGPRLRAELERFARHGLPGRLRDAARAERLLRELRPAGILLIAEYVRVEWLVAGRRTGVPTFAVQHGIISPEHVGYRHARHPGLTLPTRTFVFGRYEARFLTSEGGYREDEVVVGGAPRLDLDRRDLSPAGVSREAERLAVRHELGVADEDRLLVISGTRDRIHQRYHLVPALGQLLAEPLPGVHLVFKQHPGERGEGPYRALVEGLARAGGFSPPPLSVVRDVDLYRLLRAADAHLGLYSTVLTDAVVAGTPNLYAATQQRADTLGYLAASVARPVHDPAELREALADPVAPDPARRRAFLDDHFLPGEAGPRIAAAIAGELAPGPTMEAAP